jgi:TRAP-type uncharacterized transport system fused permease subunit
VTQLYPHIVVRTDAKSSEVSLALHCAGYVVTKARSDEDAERLVTGGHVDAVVAELPLVQAVSLARRSIGFPVPVLFVTNAPASLCKLGGNVPALHTSDAADDLVSTVDLLIASQQLALLGSRNSG